MKKIIIAGLVSLFMVGCSTDKGKDFIGTWNSTSDSEVVVITETPNGFRAETSGTFWDFEVMLKAESDRVLVSQDQNKKALELNDSGQMVSHLRNEVSVFSRQ